MVRAPQEPIRLKPLITHPRYLSLRHLKAAGIPFVVWGADALHGNGAPLMLYDLHVLVRDADLDAAAELLAGRGWVAAGGENVIRIPNIQLISISLGDAMTARRLRPVPEAERAAFTAFAFEEPEAGVRVNLSGHAEPEVVLLRASEWHYDMDTYGYRGGDDGRSEAGGADSDSDDEEFDHSVDFDSQSDCGADSGDERARKAANYTGLYTGTIGTRAPNERIYPPLAKLVDALFDVVYAVNAPAAGVRQVVFGWIWRLYGMANEVWILRQRRFVRHLRFENRQVHLDYRARVDISDEAYIAHARALRVELRNGTRQLKECSMPELRQEAGSHDGDSYCV